MCVVDRLFESKLLVQLPFKDTFSLDIRLELQVQRLCLRLLFDV